MHELRVVHRLLLWPSLAPPSAFSTPVFESDRGLPVPWSLIVQGEQLLKALPRVWRVRTVPAEPWSCRTPLALWPWCSVLPGLLSIECCFCPGGCKACLRVPVTALDREPPWGSSSQGFLLEAASLPLSPPRSQPGLPWWEWLLGVALCWELSEGSTSALLHSIPCA